MLCELYGDRTVIADARRRLQNTAARRALDELEKVVERLESAGLGSRVAIDLGDLRRHSYYTGVSMTLLAEGPGEPLGMGGRYDDLLGRYGAPSPATGFAFEVDNVSWALSEAGVSLDASSRLRVLVAGGTLRQAPERRGRSGGPRGARVAVIPSEDRRRSEAVTRRRGTTILLIWQTGKQAKAHSHEGWPLEGLPPASRTKRC